MKDSLLIVPLDLQGHAPSRLRILPAGKVELRDSRKAFEVTPGAMQEMVQTFQAEGVDLVIDWEHKTLTGDRAPAAAWIQALETAPDGLYASVDWTPEGRQDVESKKYRYWSPVLSMNPETRQPKKLMHAGLTNTPAIKNLPELLAAKYGESEILVLKDFSAAERQQAAKEGEAMPDGSFPIKTAKDVENAIHDIGRAGDPEAAKKHIIARAKALGCLDLLPADWPGSTKKPTDGGKPMKMKLQQLLGSTFAARATEATDDEVFEALSVRLKQADSLPGLAQALGLEKPEEATSSQIEGAVLALKQGSEQYTALKTELEALKTENVQGKAQKAVDEALTASKITPGQKDWALAYAIRDLEGFKAFVATAVPVLTFEPLKVKLKDGQEITLTAAEDVICKSMGIAPEAFKAQQVKEQAARDARK